MNLNSIPRLFAFFSSTEYKEWQAKACSRFKEAIQLAFIQNVRLRPHPTDDCESPAFNEFQVLYKKRQRLAVDSEKVLVALDTQSKAKYEETISAVTTVEHKADWLMTILGALCGFGTFYMPKNYPGFVSNTTWLFGIISTLPGLWLCLRSRLPGVLATVTPLHKSFENVLDYDRYAAEMQHFHADVPINTPLEDFQLWLIKSRTSAVISLQRLNNWKADCVKAAGYWLIVAFVFFIISAYLSPPVRRD